MTLQAHRLEAWQYANGPLGHRQGWHTLLTDADGNTGRGEFAPWTPGKPPRCPFAIGQAPGLSAHGAWNMAALELEALQKALPVGELLGTCRPVTGHALVRTPDEAAQAMAAGFTCLKIKLGGDGATARERVARITAAAPGVPLRLDLNGRWTPAQAIRWIPRLAEAAPIDWIEQPTARPTSLQGLGARIAWDESVRSADWALALSVGDVCVIKSTWMGGPRIARRAAIAAQTAGLEICVTSVMGSAVDRWSALHLAASLPGVRSVGLAGPADPAAPVARNGRYETPSQPGWGLC